MKCGPFSQEQLETFRAASSQISKTWDQLVEPIKKLGEKYGAAQISECGGFMDRTPEAEAKFRKALVKARLLQDNSNIQPPMIRQFFIYPYDTLFLQRRLQMARQKTTTEVRSTALNLTDKFEIPLLSIAIQHEINRITETQRRTKDSRKKLNQNFALETYEGILRAIEEAQ